MPNLQKFIDQMRYWCDEGDLGYDQSNRYDIRYGGEGDCSSLVIHALQEAGFDTGNAITTRNLSDELCSRGWIRVPVDGMPLPGDILLNDKNHVAAWLGDCLAQASIDENGNIAGGQSGDQGNETNTGPYYNYPWDCYLRYVGKDEPHQVPGEPMNDAGLWYRSHVEDLGWLDAVHDGQVAGTEGFNLKWEALKISPPEGWKLEIRLHIANVGWKRYIVEYGKSDPIMGSVGENQAIENVGIRVLKRPENTKKKRLYFCVHQSNYGWKAWTLEGNTSGTDGMNTPLEAIRMVIR